MSGRPETLAETQDLILELLRRLDDSKQTYTTFAAELMPAFDGRDDAAQKARRHLSNALRELVGLGRELNGIG